MPSEIFAFVQAQPQAQTPAPASVNTIQEDSTDIQPGLFDSLVTQYISSGEEAIEASVILMPEIPSQTVNFTSNNNSFSQAVIDVLAGETEPEVLKVPPEEPEEEEEIIWFEDALEPVIENVHEDEDLQPAIKPVEVIINKVKNFLSGHPEADIDEVISFILNDDVIPEEVNISDSEINEIVEVMKDNIPAEDMKPQDVKNIIAEHFTAPKEARPVRSEAPLITSINDDDPDDTEDTENTEDKEAPEISIPDVPAGFAPVPAVTPEAVITPDTPAEKDSPQKAPVNVPLHQAQQQPIHSRTIQRETAPAPETAQETPEAPDTPKTFREILEARASQHEESGQEDSQQDTGTPQHGQDFGQDRRDSRGNTSSRSRTESRRVDRTETSRSQPERATTNTTHRTNNFQAFFEGAVNNRRTGASMPLDIRGTYNFAQAQTIRNGLVNVVRFIRVEGVQKANMIIDPPALGRISVELTSGTAGVEAVIKVSSEQIRQLVQDQLSQLRMNLSREGVQVAEFTVDVQQDNSQGRNSQDQRQEERRVDMFRGIDDDEPEEFRIDLEEGLLYWLA